MRPTRDSDEFYTPRPIADLAKRTLGDIFFDPYGHPLQLVRTRTMQTKESGNSPWPKNGPWFCNPPFSQSAEQVPRVAKWLAQYGIDALMLCLAAPGSKYWREAIWSATGPQYIAWLPRVSFMQLDPRETLTTYSRNGRPLSAKRYATLVEQGGDVADIETHVAKNPLFGKVGPTPHTISYDTALMLWTRSDVVAARFAREIKKTYPELPEGAPPDAPKNPAVGVSRGGGPLAWESK